MTRRKGDIHALAYFTDPSFDWYFPLDGRPLSANCSKPTQNPYSSCNTKTDYKNDIALEYYYNRDHLSQWKEIDDGLKRLMDSFIAAANVDSK